MDTPQTVTTTRAPAVLKSNDDASAMKSLIYEDVTTLYVKGSTEAAQTTLVSTNLYLPYNHLYPLQDRFL